MSRVILPVAALLGAVGVVVGAFGAHALPGWLEARSVDPADIDHYVSVFETGARYHLIHAVALWGAGLWAKQQPGRWASVGIIAWLIGILVFSGCLYALALTGIKVLGAIVPLGGVALIFGWLCLAMATLPGNRS